VTFGLHDAHIEVVNDVPVEMPVHHDPPCNHRAVRSAILSPLKSAVRTSTHDTFGLHVAHRLVVNEEPVEIAVHH
jgi:hypothetical protein